MRRHAQVLGEIAGVEGPCAAVGHEDKAAGVEAAADGDDAEDADHVCVDHVEDTLGCFGGRHAEGLADFVFDGAAGQVGPDFHSPA